MNKAQTIEYAIKKECQKYSLTDWCKEWGFTINEFYKFLKFGRIYFENYELSKGGEK